MSQQKINFADYNAAGVYFPVFDNSIITGTSSQSALRVAVGFNMTGPFNRPIFVADTATVDSLLGKVDKKLERKGCFTNRNVRTMINKAPVYVMNLLNVNTTNSENNPDTVGFALLSFVPSTKMDSSTFKAPYAYMYDRTKFWIADEEAFVSNTFLKSSKLMDSSVESLDEAAMFGIGNCGTKDISVIIRKSELVSGYNVTFLDYYGSKEDIPYPWINPNDYVSDYFVDVYVISGDWGPDKYAALSSDVVWSKYFTTEGLKKDMLNKFLNLDATVLLGQWTGSILPEFADKQGVEKSIDYLINKTSNETGLMFGSNHKATDAVTVDGSVYFVDKNGTGVYEEDEDPIAKFIPDMVGHTITLDSSNGKFKILSCNCDGSNNIFDMSTVVGAVDSSAMFILDASNGEKVSVGDYVRGTNGLMTKIIKKRGMKVDPDDNESATIYKFTASDLVIDASTATKVEIHKSFGSMYDTLSLFSLKGLKIRNSHMPGYSADGSVGAEAGVKKIYSMLEDPGIKRGLLNDNSIDFRQVVDTMAYGLGAECGGKVYLSRLAANKKHCTAFINAPSISQFAASDAPFFGADWNASDADAQRPTFDIKYIPEGGNQNMIYPEDTEYFSLPSEGNGASNTGVFSCFLKYAEGSRTILVPPAADVSNTYMNKFTGGNPYATVANTDGIISNPSVTGVEYEFDDTERGYFEKMGINPIIDENGTIKIYGDRTAYQLVDSDLNFLHVRELLNTIQINCKEVLKDYVFKSNIPTTRAEITRRLNPVLSPMKESGALVKYEIECDDFNNTKDVIDNKFCIVDIGVWISQNMEKIVVPITLNRSTTA